MAKRFESRAQAEKWAALSRRGLSTSPKATVDAALDAYELYMADKGNKPTSIRTTMFRLRGLLEPVYQVDLGILHPTRCRQLYAGLIERKQKADTHRNTLAEARTFFRWCQTKGWLHRNPLDDVEPTGRRRAGKAQLRIDESRKLYDKLLTDMREGIRLNPRS